MTKATAKVAAVATGLAMATSMLSLAPIAHAATLTTAQVSSILSLLSSFGASSATIANVNAALTGGTSTSGTTTTTAGSCSFSRSLTIGSTGADVTCLQQALIAGGFSIPAGATGYFGTQTKAAVASWQSSRNVAPAVGYFGPISQGAWNLGGGSSSSTTTTTTTTTGTTGGTTTTTSTALTGNGRLTNISELGDVTNDIKVGDSATNVIGLSMDATDGDVALQRVDATFTIASTGSQSSNLDMYVSDISLYLDGVKLASMAPSGGDKSGRVWTYRFSGLNGVIKSGATGKLYIKVTPLASIGTNEDSVTTAHNVTVTLAADSVRAVGADGISDTYVAAADTVAATGEVFKVSSQTTGTLTVSLASDNPVAGIIATASSTTAGVNLLAFNMKAKNNAVTVTDLGASLGVSAGTVAATVSNVKLMKGSTTIKTGTLTTTGATYANVTFSGVDQTIAANDTVEYWISVDLKNDSGYADGTTITASTTASTLWDVSDSNGATVTPSAPAAGNAQTLIGTGLVTATFVSATATKETGTIAGSNDKVNTSLTFTLTADSGSDIYFDVTEKPGLITVLTDSSGYGWATTTDSNTGTTTAATIAAADTNSNDSAGAYFVIPAGTSRTFTITTSLTNGMVAGKAGMRFTGFNYGTASGTMTNVYNFNMGAFKTLTLTGLAIH